MWKLREKPDGILIYPDTVVRGAVIAILELGREVVCPSMQFVFHRNAHIPLLCPFPVTWAVSDEDMLAEGAIHSIIRQFRGEKASPIVIPYGFHRDEMPKRGE